MNSAKSTGRLFTILQILQAFVISIKRNLIVLKIGTELLNGIIDSRQLKISDRVFLFLLVELPTTIPDSTWNDLTFKFLLLNKHSTKTINRRISVYNERFGEVRIAENW